jgi:arylsulfatase A-like enzyme
MTQPNILLFMSDNQPADLLGCYGNDEVKTPHLDDLAKHGTRFDNAFCVNAMCSPCRASVLTGLMPSQHGIHNWLDDRLMDKWPKNWSSVGGFSNLPSIIKQAGYNTAMIGKYHLGVPFEPQLAFDHWVTFPHGHTTSFYNNDVIDQKERYNFAGHTVDFFTEKTIEYLEHQSGEENPFFAFVPYNGPYGHWPAIKGRPDFEFADLYDDSDMHSIPREGLSSEVLDRFGLRVAEGGVREQFKGPLLLPNNVESLRNYFAQVSLIDAGVGRILATLERLNLDEDTIVIYTSDHGFSLGHNGIWGHGAAAFPASAHRPSYNIPLIVSGVGVAENKVIDGFVSQIDLFPTLASMAGAKGARPSMPSSAQDLGPVLKQEDDCARDAVFYEQEETRAIRTHDWVFAMRFQDAPTYPIQNALYRLSDDPFERVNLSGLAKFAKVEAELASRVSTYFEAYSDPKYDLWHGGTAKSNVTFQALWQDAWGEDWQPEYST